MTGSFSARLQSSLSSLSPSETTPPTLPDFVLFSSNAEVPSANARQSHHRFVARQAGLPFAEQTGPIRYAPQPVLPPKKIRLKQMRRLNPMSSARIATTNLPIPQAATTTIVPSILLSTRSMQNTVRNTQSCSHNLKRPDG